jgi:transcription initiation factor IIE alpha subunit
MVMEITSKVKAVIKWKDGDEMKSITIIPGKKSYNELCVNNAIVRQQLLALQDVKLITFEIKLENPSQEEINIAWNKPSDEKIFSENIKSEIENVRAIIEKPKGIGRVRNTNLRTGGVSDKGEN